MRPLKTEPSHSLNVRKRAFATGGYSEVFAAKDSVTGRRMAVKIIAKNDNFKRDHAAWEAKVFDRIPSHKHICDVFATQQLEVGTIVVMERLEADLLNLILERGRLSERRTQKIFRGIVSAMEAIHDCDIAHHDLKLENIMFAKDGQAKLIDFGLSVDAPDGAICDAYWGTGYISSPEMLAGLPYMAKKSDVYALGVCVYTALTGRMPFSCKLREQYAQAMDVSYLESLHFPSSVSMLARAFVLSCLAPLPSKRPYMDKLAQHPWLQRKSAPRRP